MKVVIWLALASSLVASLPPSNGQQEDCPVVFLKDGCSAQDSLSTCWSPGLPDVDCPNNGICCFDGCSNKCGIPERGAVLQRPKQLTTPLPLPPPTTTECSVVMIKRNQTVLKEMCTQVQGPETCREVTEEECSEKCRDVAVPSQNCTTVPRKVCVDKPCFPEPKLVPVQEEECKTVPGECLTVPEQVCHNVTEQACDGITAEECDTLTGADCGCKTVCSWEKQLKCPKMKMMGRWRRSASHRRPYYGRPLYFKPYYHSGGRRRYHHYSTQPSKTSYYNDGLKWVTVGNNNKPVATTTPQQPCRYEKVKTCKEVPYPDTHTCQKCREVPPACKNVTRQDCKAVEVTQCSKPQDVCTQITKTLVVNSTDHCSVQAASQTCTTVNDEVCKVTTRTRRVCAEHCQPLAKKVCQPGPKTKKECRQVPKIVFFEVPKKVCH